MICLALSSDGLYLLGSSEIVHRYNLSMLEDNMEYYSSPKAYTIGCTFTTNFTGYVVVEMEYIALNLRNRNHCLPNKHRHFSKLSSRGNDVHIHNHNSKRRIQLEIRGGYRGPVNTKMKNAPKGVIFLLHVPRNCNRRRPNPTSPVNNIVIKYSS